MKPPPIVERGQYCGKTTILTMRFNHSDINFDILKKRAFNLRWASLNDGVIPLTAADPDFPTAPVVVEALEKFISDGYFSYGPGEGYLFFRESIKKYFEKKRNFSAPVSQILPVDSAAAGIAMVCNALLKKGDEAIVFNPVDFLFKYCIEKAGAKAVHLQVSINPESEIDYSLLEYLINKNTKIICLCNPLNPTGKVFRRDELEKIAEIAIRNNIYILSDEIWSDIVFNPFLYTSIASLNEETSNRTITIHGFSKSYGLAGLRVGCVLTTNNELFTKIYMASLHESTVNGCNVLGQVAATAALEKGEDWLNSFLVHLQKMRDLCLKHISEMPQISAYTPQGCYLLLCDIRDTLKSNLDIQQLLMEQARVAVVPGLPKWFGSGAEGYFRLCFSTSEIVLTESFNRMKPVFELLQSQTGK